MDSLPSEWRVILSIPDAMDFYKLEKLSMMLINTIPDFYRQYSA
ncbi:hypothetical protein ACF958_003105 [Providencia rettgeri]